MAMQEKIRVLGQNKLGCVHRFIEFRKDNMGKGVLKRHEFKELKLALV